MKLLADSLLPLLKWKLKKSRADDYSDQFNRIIMVKVCLVVCIILGMNWMKDSMGCMVHEITGLEKTKAYVNQACWIQGLYVYREEWKGASDGLRYYGIPRELKHDGMKPKTGELCSVSAEKEHGCRPMLKVFYLQYQWFPLFMGAIAMLYYVPYIFYKYVNIDLINLKITIKKSRPDVSAIVKFYFNNEANPISTMRLRVFGNILIKIFYIMVNVIAFVATDSLINNDFKSYGSDIINWNKKSNDAKFDYTSTRTNFRAGDKLLPSYGICEVLELARDIKHTLYNKHIFICEVSQNVLYQYMLMLVWFLYVLGTVISIVGLIRLLVDHSIHIYNVKTGGKVAGKIYGSLAVREMEYLNCIRNKKKTVYDDVVDKLKEQRSLSGPLLPSDTSENSESPREKRV